MQAIEFLCLPDIHTRGISWHLSLRLSPFAEAAERDAASAPLDLCTHPVSVGAQDAFTY